MTSQRSVTFHQSCYLHCGSFVVAQVFNSEYGSLVFGVSNAAWGAGFYVLMFFLGATSYIRLTLMLAVMSCIGRDSLVLGPLFRALRNLAFTSFVKVRYRVNLRLPHASCDCKFFFREARLQLRDWGWRTPPPSVEGGSPLKPMGTALKLRKLETCVFWIGATSHSGKVTIYLVHCS